MGKVIVQALGFSTELLSELSSRFSKTETLSRQVVSQLDKSGTIAKAFVPKAKKPNVKWGYNKSETSQTINFTFRDGEQSLTSGSFTAAENGRIDYNFNFVNSETGAQNLSTRGFYDPKKPLFSSQEHGGSYDWNHGELTISAHSSGFSNETTTNKEYLCDVVGQVKNFFGKVFGNKENVGQMFFPGEVPV